MPNPKDLIRMLLDKELTNARDDLSRARLQCRRYTPEQMNQSFPHSNQTPQQMLDVYELYADEISACAAWLDAKEAECNEARAIANDRDAMVDHRDRALTAMYQCVDVITQERDEARAKVERLRKVLHRLACLGNGDQYGTSFGNDIAREVLAATEAKP
jgi:DNA repair ATPase RecN